MIAEGQSPSFNTSGTSSNIDNSDNIDVLKVKTYVKDLLKSRIFLGRYVERRLISQSTTYRDIVVISHAEVELKRDLQEAQLKLQNLYTAHWIGVTSAEILGNNNGVCIWTEIDNQPFGAFWFQIKNIKFRKDEVMITVKCLRHISDAFLELEPILTSRKNIETLDKKDASSLLPNESVIDDLTSALSINNIREFVTFLFAFVIAIFTGSTSFVNFLGNFILALIREMSVLIKHSTPMFLGVLDFFGKIIGGFYILLAMFFKPNPPIRADKRNLRSINYMNHNNYDHRYFD